MALSASIADRLNTARRDLLDLGLRNTLLNYRLTKSRGVQLVGNEADDVVRWLVGERRSLTFLPSGRDEASEQDELSLFPAQTGSERGAPALLTAHSEKNLQTRLLATYYAARTHIEERGVNILFIAVGMLHWFEDDSSDKELKAPLFLVPVELERTSAREKFTVKYNEEDLEENLSLATKLKAEFGIDYPELPEVDELRVQDYIDDIAKCVSGRSRWRVEANEIALGFFSFAKFLMFRDLETTTWCTKDNPDATPLLAALIRDGFREAGAIVPDDAYLDRVISPSVLNQVVDADSSQALAMLDVRSGRNLVIQGPPGTGKSQTIANLIADALGEGKRVLFVAEKMAALEVVKRRLDKVGIGDACLELHSHSANKKAVLRELQRTLQLGQPRLDVLRWELDHYKSTRDQLNAYCLAVNSPVGESGLTPHDLMGELVGVARTQEGATLPRPAFQVAGDQQALDQILSWNRASIEQKQVYVTNLQTHLARMGVPSRHPFRDTRLGALLPSDRELIAQALQTGIATAQVLHAAVTELAQCMGIRVRFDRNEAEVLARGARRAIQAPHLQGVQLKTGDWQAKRDALRELLTAGQGYAKIRRQHAQTLIEEAWDQDLLGPRQVLNTVGRKWWRWFSSEYRRARNAVAGLCQSEAPKDVESLLELVEGVMEAARLRRTVLQHEPLAASLYGIQWEGLQSDWSVLGRLADWIVALYRDVGDGNLPAGIIDFLAGSPALDGLKSKVTTVEAALPKHSEALTVLCNRLDLVDAARTELGGAEFPAQIATLEAMLQRLPDLPDAIALSNLRAVLAKEGLQWIFDTAWDWPEAARLLVPLYRRACFEAFLRKAYAEREALRGFNGSSHESTRERFKELDAASLRATQLQLAAKHWENLPKLTTNGQLGVLLREFQKRSRHLPVRKLIDQAGNAIQAIKPVFMMSPMSIAAFVPPRSIKFDLIIFDEASQVKPVDAFGAILRGQQLVVVGDSKQLPPTSFFDALVGDDDPEEEDEHPTSDIESVLGLMAGQGAPERMLRWHYRSRHQSLINLSNQEFYENRLVVFPSPEPAHRGLGLVFHHLQNTVYDRGRSRTNQKEAEVVAKAVMVHAKTSPHLTLGVAAFSLQQAEAIIDRLERMRRDDPSTESFFSAHPFEPFFVKNLESVQGDERDVIFISIGYGRNEEGFVSMNFGALNGQGGERRLNVLVTRARQCCEVFTNLTHDDIDLTRTPARGVAALKAFLKYAQTGIADVPDTGVGEEDSPFEREVATALRSSGHDVALQVGSGGFRIDLAVRDPNKPGRYLLGIECDGATYHRSRSSRDRDRLRQQVLENLGWRIHRIWSSDWFNHKDRELRRTLEAIANAAAHQPQHRGLVDRPAPLPERHATPAVPRTRGSEEPVIVELKAPPYRICELAMPKGTLDLHEVPASRFAGWIAEVVRTEGPVHRDDVGRRIADAAGVKRIGNRIDAAFSAGVRAASASRQVDERGEFLWPARLMRAVVRDRSSFGPVNRKIELIAPEEIAEAVCMVVESAFGIDIEEIPPAVCRLLGFGRTTEEMSAPINRIVLKLGRSGRIEIEDGHATMRTGVQRGNTERVGMAREPENPGG